MHYMVYFPGEQDKSNAPFIKFGLENLVDGKSPVMIEVSQVDGTPDESKGLLAAWHTGGNTDHHSGMPSDFAWTANAKRVDLERGAYFIGIHNEWKPKPKELAKPKQFNGIDIQLGDEQFWKTPSVRALPHSHGIDFDSGEDRRFIDERYVEFERRAGLHALAVFDENDAIIALSEINGVEDPNTAARLREEALKMPSIEDIEGLELAVNIPFREARDQAYNALEINYRINREIITLLDLLGSDENVIAICGAAFDLPAIQAAIKKKRKGEGAGILVTSDSKSLS